jgi:hypothetical protein
MSDKFTVTRLQLNVDTDELGAAFSPDRTRVLTAVDRTVLTAAWTSDQRHAISCDARGGIRVWNLFD